MITPAGIMMFTCYTGQQRAVCGRSPGFTNPAVNELIA